MISWIILSGLIFVLTGNGSTHTSFSYSADVSSETNQAVQEKLYELDVKHDVSSQSIAQVHHILEREKYPKPEPIMHHHDNRHEIVSGSITAKSPTETVINLEVDEKKSDDRNSPRSTDNSYTKRFVVITNSVTAITTALIGAGVAILIHFKGCS